MVVCVFKDLTFEGSIAKEEKETKQIMHIALPIGNHNIFNG